MTFSSNLFWKNKSKHGRSRKSGEGSSSAASGHDHPPPESAGSSAGGGGSRGVIVVWDLNTCEIPTGWELNQVCENIPLAINSDIARFYIFCHSPTVRQTNQVITEFPPVVLEIVSTAETLTCRHVLVITGDLSYCPTLSILRQRNLYVGLACLRSHYKMLQLVASYARDWKKIARCIVPNFLIEPRRSRTIAPDDDRCKMYPVYIYWDLQSCPIQEKFGESEESMLRLTEKFQDVLRAHNYWGHFKVFTYGLLRGMRDEHHQALYCNFMSFQSVVEGSRIDASKMILDDISEMLYECDCVCCFMIISDGDVESAEELVKSQMHDLVVVRTSSSSSLPDVTLKWPIFWEEE